MASDELITKRIHISGLTPSLTAADISQRLSSFGTVKAVDGFDLLDGVGRPRKFGYVTLETTPSKFARCCNLLSGTTWKGAKLRIGEAKPDFRERIAAENATAKRDAEEEEESRLSRERQRVQKYGAVHAQDMSLVTKENVNTRPGWIVTPLGRIVRPVKMKPPRPLASVDASTGKVTVKKKKRKAEEELRAKRQKIDMLKYGSVHLKGVFVDVAIPDVGYDGRADATGGDDDAMETEVDAEDEGSEDMVDNEPGSSEEEAEGSDEEDEDMRPIDEEPSTADNRQSEKSVVSSTNKLKDLFAPRDEEAGFSLLGHLDLDLELDDDVPFPIANEEHQPLQASEIPEHVPTTVPSAQTRTRALPAIQLDPKQPLFFPIPSSSTLGPLNKGRVRDLFDVAKERGWNWRDPSVAFYRTETEDGIRQRWEESKGELTREWKKRSKEASKMSRRKYGGAKADGE